MRRPLSAIILVLSFLLPAGHAKAAPDLGLVNEALEILAVRHWNPNLDLPTLIRAGVGGLRRELRRVGVDGSTLTEISAGIDRQQAMTAFGDRLEQAVRLAGTRVTERQLLYAALRSMFRAVGGSHTAFLDQRAYTIQSEALRGMAFADIGVNLTQRDDQVIIGRVIPANPAWQAGIRRGDVVLRVDDTSVGDYSASEVRPLILGDPGTKVRLTLRRGSREYSVEVERTVITVPAVESRTLSGGISYLKLYGYWPSMLGPVTSAVSQLLAGGFRGLILDLRDDRGGTDIEARSVLGLLLPTNTVVGYDIDRTGTRKPIVTVGTPVIATTIPITVLIDVGTRSNGELVASALKEIRGATLVGGRTEGAVEFFRPFRLSDGSGINVSTDRTVSARGAELEGRGVMPDVEVRYDPDAERDLQLERAIQLLMQRISGRVMLRAS